MLGIVMSLNARHHNFQEGKDKTIFKKFLQNYHLSNI